MNYPIIFVKSFSDAQAGIMLINGTPEKAIENRPFPKRYYNFNMVITVPLTYSNQGELILTDDDGMTMYHLIDRLGNPVLANQIKLYAGTRRCLSCRFDSATNTVMVLSCLCPTDFYIKKWLEEAK